MLHGLGSRRARVLNRLSSNSREVEKENTAKPGVPARKSARIQSKTVGEKHVKAPSQAEKQQKNTGGVLKAKQKQNVIPISSNILIRSSKRGTADAVCSPDKKARTSRISLAPDCELRVSARTSIKRSTVESKQKIAKELFKPISVLLGEKVELSDSPSNRTELRKKTHAKNKPAAAHKKTTSSNKVTATHKTSALRLSPLPSEILNLPPEQCPQLKEDVEEDSKFTPPIKIDHKSLFGKNWFDDLIPESGNNGDDSFSDLSDDDVPSINQRIYCHQLLKEDPAEFEKSLSSLFKQSDAPTFTELFSSA